MDERAQDLRRRLAQDAGDQEAARSLIAFHRRSGAEGYRLLAENDAVDQPAFARAVTSFGALCFAHPEREGSGAEWWLFFRDFADFLAWVQRLNDGRVAVTKLAFTVDWPRKTIYYRLPSRGQA